MHFVWDTLLLRDVIGRRKIAEVATGMEQGITPQQRKQWAQGTPEQWANETHRLAVERAYHGVSADGPPPKLDERYVAAAKAAAVEQVTRGGFRLAAILNGSLK